MKPVFFYGLFMDPELLKGKGLSPSNPMLACIKGYGLRIGERASIVKSENECAYGLIVSLEQKEIEALYGEESVLDYIPEKITAVNSSGENIDATTYTLPSEKLKGRNKDYAKTLAILAKKLGLPSDYIEEIERWSI
ncbi:MAG: hypothetical protein ACI9H8_001976 [Lysobacterales bacterium]|jgi:hypothetical protein